MTYHDPKLPDPGLDRNPPRYRTANSFGMESILVLTVLAAVIGAILFYPSGDTSGTTASNPPPTTTGQGGTPVSSPGARRNTPTPAAPPTTLPPIDQNVPAEKIAPPIPTEPR